MLTDKQLSKIINHDSCDGELHVVNGMYMARGIICSGIRCTKCNGLWINSEDDFLEKMTRLSANSEEL